ncbi:MAG TPA: hypothetical protein P5105_04170 [Victivallales bacterium]|nr:hypothetical protein [Victivallales bacterium]HRR06458.1 hypothetical protein [Victivallales bacterium]
MKIKKTFTLLELIISVMVMAMVISTLSIGLNGIFSSWGKTAKLSYRTERFIIIDRILDSAFRNAIPFSWKDENNRKRFIFLGDKEEVLVSYLKRINNPQDGALNFLRLKVENNTLVAYYRKTPILWWQNDYENMTREEVCSGVKRISFLYADIENDQIIWLEDWDEENFVNIPLAIQLKIEFEDGESEVWLRRTAGSGRRETWGLRRLNRR